ncbi:beta-ketoacyl-[acyl-carrier-protein] synthase family protein [Kangiella marina]|uniref:Beta-ketoacyl-[acyl-carrier-protein] synthase family protein n=1 Tax=Kangiella marina TaxID=1079178 RepID=A0ABP8IK14_9GAMM
MPMTKARVYLNHMSLINALGSDHQEILSKLITGDTSNMTPYTTQLSPKTFIAGKVTPSLPAIPQHLSKHQTRNNQLILHCLQQLQPAFDKLQSSTPNHRIGVVLGTSTSGIAEGELALNHHHKQGEFPASFDYSQIQMSSPAAFIADYWGITGPTYSVSTACSSSGKVFASARSLIQNNLCDAVIVGGADSLCDMTLHGFNALEAISPALTNPFSSNRSGINIGEGAALFIMTRDPSAIELRGVGESSDAHHISAPHPEGQGAKEAMLMALEEAGLSGDDIDYLNLHGTATELNDAMESQAVQAVLSHKTHCSSTKPLTGHTLGAAGATELAFCWLLLQQTDNERFLAKHCYDGDYDPALAPITLADGKAVSSLTTAMSNSFAFGGNNVSVIIASSER